MLRLLIHSWYLPSLLKPRFENLVQSSRGHRQSAGEKWWWVCCDGYISTGTRLKSHPSSAKTRRQMGWHSPVRDCHASLSPLLSGQELAPRQLVSHDGPQRPAKRSWWKPLRVYCEASSETWLRRNSSLVYFAPEKNVKLLEYLISVLVRQHQTAFCCLPHDGIKTADISGPGIPLNCCMGHRCNIQNT